MTAAATFLCACTDREETPDRDSFVYSVDQFADLQILRYRVPGFEDLSLNQKKLIYYLSEAALQGRDILFDQNNKYNLTIRKLLESVYLTYTGEKTSSDYQAFEVYLKRVWFSNGIHHHYGSEKFIPGFSETFLKEELAKVDLPAMGIEGGLEEVIREIFPVIFDPAEMA